MQDPISDVLCKGILRNIDKAVQNKLCGLSQKFMQKGMREGGEKTQTLFVCVYCVQFFFF